MCGRYLVKTDDEELRGIIEEAAADGEAEHDSYVFSGGEIFPGNVAPVVTQNRKARFMT